MKLRRFLLASTAVTMAISLSGCAGFLRSISSDNQVSSVLDDAGYTLDTRDFRLEMGGQWDWLRGEAVVELPRASEYNVGVVNPEGVSVQARAEVRRGDTGDCAGQLGKDLPELGWNVDGRFDSSVDVNGQSASVVRAYNQARDEVRVFCFRSEQQALVYFFVTAPEGVDAVAAPLLESAITWK